VSSGNVACTFKSQANKIERSMLTGIGALTHIKIDKDSTSDHIQCASSFAQGHGKQLSCATDLMHCSHDIPLISSSLLLLPGAVPWSHPHLPHPVHTPDNQAFKIA
jgi:hypothetical protein